MTNDLGSLGPILGSDACKHESVRYYNGIEGVYAVCGRCGGHFWDPVVPAGADIVDLNSFDEDEDDEDVQRLEA